MSEKVMEETGTGMDFHFRPEYRRGNKNIIIKSHNVAYNLSINQIDITAKFTPKFSAKLSNITLTSPYKESVLNTSRNEIKNKKDSELVKDINNLLNKLEGCKTEGNNNDNTIKKSILIL